MEIGQEEPQQNIFHLNNPLIYSLLTLKEPGAGIRPPLDIFCYASAGCYFFALKLHDFFLQALRLI